MLEFLLGALTGATGGFIAKDRILPNPLEQKVAELQQKLLLSSKDNDKLKDKILCLQQEVKEKSAELKTMRNVMYAKEDAADDKEDSLKEMQNRVDKYRSENESLKKDLAQMNMLYAARKQELETIQDEYDELKRDIGK